MEHSFGHTAPSIRTCFNNCNNNINSIIERETSQNAEKMILNLTNLQNLPNHFVNGFMAMNWFMAFAANDDFAAIAAN